MIVRVGDKVITVAFRVSKRLADDVRMITYVLGYAYRSDLLREILEKGIREYRDQVSISQNSGQLSQFLSMEKDAKSLYLEGL
jgi:metal-responsive CopG/Arc/MetJ family transcriptional regulator